MSRSVVFRLACLGVLAFSPATPARGQDVPAPREAGNKQAPEPKVDKEKPVEATVKLAPGTGCNCAAKGDKGDDKAFDTMKELFTGQKDLYSNHLQTLTILATFVSVLIIAIQVWFQLKTDRQNRSLEGQVKEAIAASKDQITAGTGMFQQMTSVMALNSEQERRAQEYERQRAAEQAARKEASDSANRVAAGFIIENGVYTDGIVSALDGVQRELTRLRAAGNRGELNPAVFFVEGLHEALVRGDNRAAIRVWAGDVLGHRDIGTNAEVRRRAEHLIGLSHLKLGEYDQALAHYQQARELAPDNLCYDLSWAEATILQWRGKAMPADTRAQLAAVFDRLEAGLTGGSPNIGKMPLPAFRAGVVYWHCQFLINESGDDPAARARGEEILAREASKLEVRTSMTDGLQFALLRKQKAKAKLKDELLDGAIDQCDADVSGIDDPLEEFSVFLRKARYLGWRSVLRGRAGDATGEAADQKSLAVLVNGLRRKLGTVKRTFRDARIYSPLTRRHELPAVVAQQLDQLLDLGAIRAEVASW